MTVVENRRDTGQDVERPRKGAPCIKLIIHDVYRGINA